MAGFDGYLAQALNSGVESAYANNPFYTGGQNLMQFQPQWNPYVSEPSNSYLLQALLAPLAGGIYKSIGEGQVTDELRPKVLSQLSSMEAPQSALSTVLSQGWNPKEDQLTLMSALADAEKKKDLVAIKEQRKTDSLDRLNNALIQRGYKADENGNVSEIPELKEMLLQDRREAALAKPLSESTNKEFAAKTAGINQIRDLANRIDNYGKQNGSDWYGSKLDFFGISEGAKLQKEAKAVANRFGADIEKRMTDQDRSFYLKLMNGGLAWDAKNSAKMMKIIADSEQKKLLGTASMLESLRANGGSDLSQVIMSGLNYLAPAETSASEGAAGGLPSVGSVYNGAKVTSVRKVR